MKMYQGNEELKEMQDSVKDFINFHSIPKALSKRMTDSFEHTWSYTNGIDMNTVLKSFPESLQADICLHLNRQLLNKSLAFQDATEGCLRMLALQFKSTHVPPGDTLIHKGDNLVSIFFIARGTLEIARSGEVLAILDKNDIFGENIGKYQERDVMGRSSCDVRALSYCDLHKIDRCDLLDVLEIYPDFAECFERKFQVTFDLRECEMFDAKPLKKTKTKALLKLTATMNTLTRFASVNTAGNESVSLLQHQHSDFGGEAHSDTLEASKSSLVTSNKNLTGGGVDKSLTITVSGTSPVDSTAMNLSNTMSESGGGGGVTKFNQSMNASASDAPRKFSALLRKKSKLIRTSSNRLNPMLSNFEKKPIVSGPSLPLNIGMTGTRQISSLSEVETELESLLT